MGKVLLSESIANRLLQDFAGVETLPGERELSERYVCSRKTLRSALSILAGNGLLNSKSRSGHALTPLATELTAETIPARKPVIMMLSMEDRFIDPAHDFMLGGAIHQARMMDVSLVVREVTFDSVKNNSFNLDALSEGIEPDGYFIAGFAPVILHEKIQKTMKPCVMLGRFYEEETHQKRSRCKQIVLNDLALFHDLGKMFSELGHKKILCVPLSKTECPRSKALESALSAGSQCDIIRNWPENDIITPEFQRATAEKVIRSLDGHTALVVPHGHIYGLEILCHLQKLGIRIPQDLSVIITETETDWYLETFGISSVFFPVFEQGAYSVNELCKQIKSGKLEYGFAYTSISYVDRGSVAHAKTDKKITRR